MQFQGQYADSLLAFERLHLAKLLVWTALSGVLGSLIIAALIRSRASDRPPLLWHFGLQLQGWAIGLLALVLLRRSMLSLRDLDAAIRLEHLTWLSVGLDLGVVLLGVTLVVIGRRLGARLGMVGAGLALVLQGSALAFLDLQLAATIVR